uniref:Coiled-coil domain containing 69 n=1 Tax=Ornithorhynchus anatinus TaxID=9258 RepID=A0A6I8NIM8_ORNAN
SLVLCLADRLKSLRALSQSVKGLGLAGWRRQKAEQLPKPETQELGSLKADSGQTSLLCKETAELLEKQQREISRILQQHEEEKERLEADHRADKEKQAQEIRVQVTQERELELQEKLAEQFRALTEAHDGKLREIHLSNEREKAALTESFQAAQSSLKDTIDALNSQLEPFQTKMKRVEESILSRDYKKHIQDYGSPSQFWEQELKSLHFVIEMKNERIHEQDRKLMNLETVKEKNLFLEEKIKTLQQENEDLRVRGQNHLLVSRQLSDELLLVQEALEKESRSRQQIRQEKEELLYQLLNNSPQAFPLSSVTPTEVSFLPT